MFENRLPRLTLIVLLLASCSNGGRAPADRMIDIGTHRLHAVVVGEGSPAVIIDGGIGALCEEYFALQNAIAKEATVVAYDRAGYGRSEAGPLPRDSGTEAAELRALLAELDVRGPYVFVGHSLGGLNLQIYADRYPDEVAGMVLLDPPPLAWILGEGFDDLRGIAEQMTGEWQEIADRGLDSTDGRQRAQAVFFQMLASEHREMLGTSARLAGEIRSFNDIQLIVIAAGVPNPQFGDVAADYQQYWINESRALSEKSDRGKVILAEGSTHQLHADAEDLVVKTVLAVVEEVSGKRLKER